MTKKELKQIYNLNREVEMWQRELDKKQCRSIVGSQVITGMPFGSGTSDRVADMACDIVETEMIIRGRLAEIQQQRKKIMEYINSIGDSLIRQIIFYRYVSCMEWWEVADSIGGNNTANGVRMACERFLTKK